MQARVAVLEALAQSTDKRLSLIEADLRSLLRLVLGVYAVVIGTYVAIAGGYLLLQSDIRATEQRLSAKIESIARAVNAPPVPAASKP